MLQPNKPTACAMLRYEVTQADLPLSCPSPKYRLWDAHPRVYLPIAATGRAICPYCNAEYVLTPEPGEGSPSSGIRDNDNTFPPIDKN